MDLHPACTTQTLCCFERKEEVYFANISTGAKFDAEGNAVDVWATPPGEHPVWRKLVSIHMSGGTTGGEWILSRVFYDPGDATVPCSGGTIIEVVER
jgi:hypothetical protein